MVATQSALPLSLVPASLAFLIFTQNLGGSIVAIIANTIFTQSLLTKLAHYAPSVPPQSALSAGGSADAVRSLLPAGSFAEFDGILRAYYESLRNVWYLLIGLAIGSFLFAWGMGWVDVRKKNGKIATAAVVEESRGSEKSLDTAAA